MIHLVCLCLDHEACIEHDEEQYKMSIIETTTDHDKVTCPRCLTLIAYM